MHCAAEFMPLAASHWATVWKEQFAMPETPFRQTGEPCARAAGAAISATRRLDEAISVLMRNSFGRSSGHNKWLAAIVPDPKVKKSECARARSRLAGTPGQPA